jgi:hypothetical protein
MNKKLIAKGFIVLLFIISLIGIGFYIEDNIESNYHYGKCYDRYGNEIINQTCIVEEHSLLKSNYSFAFLALITLSLPACILLFIKGFTQEDEEK